MHISQFDEWLRRRFDPRFKRKPTDDEEPDKQEHEHNPVSTARRMVYFERPDGNLRFVGVPVENGEVPDDCTRVLERIWLEEGEHTIG